MNEQSNKQLQPILRSELNTGLTKGANSLLPMSLTYLQPALRCSLSALIAVRTVQKIEGSNLRKF